MTLAPSFRAHGAPTGLDRTEVIATTASDLHWSASCRVLLVATVVVALVLPAAPIANAQTTAVALVQHSSTDAGTTNASSLAFSANNGVGNWIGVVIRAGVSGDGFTVTDVRGNVYRQAVQLNVTVDTPAGDTLAIFYAENIAGGPNTITVAASITSSLRFAILEYSGVAMVNSLDGTAAAQGTSANPTSGSTTTSAAGDLLLGAIATANGRTFTAGSGYVIQDNVPAAPNTKLVAEHQIQASAGPAAASAAFATADHWGAALAAFRPGSGGGGGGGGDTQAPTMPTSVSATSSSGSQIDLSWTASTDNVGVTSYQIERCQGAGCSSFAPVATVNATPASAPPVGPPSMGPLTASANPNYFKDGSGASIVLNGSHTWNTLQDWGTNGSLRTLDFPAFVNFLVAHGNNFTLLWRTEMPKFCGLPTTASSPPDFTVGPHPWRRTGPGTATDGGLKFDLASFDQSYFDRLRVRTQALNNAGIYAGVYLFTGEWLNVFRCATDGYPFTRANNVNGIDDGYSSGSLGTGSMTMSSPNAITAIQDAYVEKVVDTLNDLPNVLWIVSEEGPTNTTWWNEHHIAHVRSYESDKPSQHPIGYGIPLNANDSVLTNSSADWVSPSARISPSTTCGTGTPRCKVNLNDSDHSMFGMWNESAQGNRNYAWENFTAGNQVAFMDPYVVNYPREGRNLCAAPVNAICAAPDARWNNFRDNLGYILRYSRKLNLANVLPASSLCSTSFCLAQTPSIGAEYLIYAPNGGSFTVNLSAMSSSRTLTVEWFNPSTGATTTASSVPAGSSSQTFVPPFSGDALLYLVDAAGHAGSTMATSVTWSDSGLTASTTYSYRVRAMDAASNLSPYSAVATATTRGTADAQPPTTPTNLTANSSSSSQSNLNWAASTDNVAVTRYMVERCSGAGCAGFVQVGTTAGTSFVSSGLTASTSYSYRVRATDAANNMSAYSQTASSTTSAGPGGIMLVQHTGKDAGTTTSSSFAFASNNSAGNFIAVAIRAGKTGQAFTVSDTRGNRYGRAVQINESVDGTSLALFYAENIAAGANTITVSDSIGGGTLRVALFEYSGVATTNSLDVAAAAQGTGVAASSGSATTTSSGDLVIGIVSSADPVAFTPGSGYVIQERVPTVPNTKLAVEDQRQTTAGAVSAGATMSAPNSWGAAMAAFRRAP